MDKEDEVIAMVDPRAAIAAQYRHHRLSASALAGLSRPYFGTPTRAGQPGSMCTQESDGPPPQKRRRKQRSASSERTIENTPGLCDWLAELHREWHSSAHAAGHVGCVAAQDRERAADDDIGVAKQWSLGQWGAFVEQLQSHVSPGAAGVVCTSVPCAASHPPGSCIVWRLSPDQLFNRLVVHCGTSDARVEALDRTWVIPPRCRFVMADVCSWSGILMQDIATVPNRASTYLDVTSNAAGSGSDTSNKKRRGVRQGGYRIITLDPPWANKSADRGKRYPTKAWELLPELPIPQLAAPPAGSLGGGCLVAVWVTNKSSYWEWLVNTVFPRWGVCYVTTWFWLKVCNDGSPVMPIDSRRERKPFEPLVLGVFPPPLSPEESRSCSSGPSARDVGNSESRIEEQRPPNLATSVGHEEGRSYWLPPWRSTSVPSVGTDQVSSTAMDASSESSCHSSALPDVADGELGNDCRGECELGELWRVPLKQVFCSVPMEHSAKPQLDTLLNQCFSGNKRRESTPNGAAGCGSNWIYADDSISSTGAGSAVGGERLELFARCLRTVTTTTFVVSQHFRNAIEKQPSWCADRMCVGRVGRALGTK